MPGEATFTLTKINTLKLIHKGFSYIKRPRTKNGWRCIKHSNGKCRGRAETREIGSRQMVEVFGVHNHPPK